MKYFRTETRAILRLMALTFGLRAKAAIIWFKFKWWLRTRQGVFAVDFPPIPEEACFRCDRTMLAFRATFYQNLITRNSRPKMMRAKSISAETLDLASDLLENSRHVRLERSYYSLGGRLPGAK